MKKVFVKEEMGIKVKKVVKKYIERMFNCFKTHRGNSDDCLLDCPNYSKECFECAGYRMFEWREYEY